MYDYNYKIYISIILNIIVISWISNQSNFNFWLWITKIVNVNAKTGENHRFSIEYIALLKAIIFWFFFYLKECIYMMYRQYSYHLVLTRSFSFCIFTKQYFALLIVRKKCDTNPNYRNVFFPQSKECDPQFYFRIFLIYLKRKRKYYALSRRKREQEIGELIYRALHISVDCVASTGMKA